MKIIIACQRITSNNQYKVLPRKDSASATDDEYMAEWQMFNSVRTILVSGIGYRTILVVSASINTRTILSLYSHAILVSCDGW